MKCRIKAKELWDKIGKCFCIKNVTLMTIILFVLMLLPILYCSFFNRASGDDYGYSVFTREAWLMSHSLVEVLRAIGRTIEQYYIGWQGTWFSIFLFTLQPEIFSEKAYVIVAFLILFLWISSTFLLFRKLLKDVIRFDGWSVNLLILLFLIISISFVPKKKSAIFWYNGCAHYMIPFVMCQMVVYWLLKYREKYQKRYLPGIIIFATLLGGANYQAALFSLIAVLYFVGVEYLGKRNKKVFWLSVPLILEVIGLIISMKAPGNAVRGGDNFGFSVELIFSTIFKSFLYGLKDICNYFQTTPMIFVGLLAMFLITLEAVKNRGIKSVVKYPILMLLSVFCLYSAMQAPAIYAGVEVSGGVYNMNFLVFMMMMMIVIVVIAEKIGDRTQGRRKVIWDQLHTKVFVPGIMVCLLLLLVCRSDIKETTTWMCLEYITTGQASDYKEQMEQFTELMTQEGVEDVVVPFINDVQGPLMHMPVTENPEAWTNTVVCQYYNKNSVIAMPRPEWEEKYGDK